MSEEIVLCANLRVHLCVVWVCICKQYIENFHKSSPPTSNKKNAQLLVCASKLNLSHREG